MLEGTKIVIDEFTHFTEKCNTMLAGDDGATVAWIKIGNVGPQQIAYLEIADTPGNSPRLSVQGTWTTAKKLRAHARKTCKGWHCVRWNIDEKPPIDKNGDIK